MRSVAATLPPACASGFVNGACHASAKYKLPARKGDFYTMWSFFMCWIAVGLALVYVVAQGALGCKPAPSSSSSSSSSSSPSPSNAANVMHSIIGYGVVPVILWGAANSLGVLATSQQFLAWNFTQGVKTDGSKQDNTEDDGAQLGMTLPFCDAVFRDNFIVHIVPGLAAFVVLLLLATGRNGPNINRWFVMLAGFVCMVVFVALYLCTPAVDENGKQYFGWAKIQYVYNDPKPWMFAAQLALSALTIVVVPSCLLNRENPWATACASSGTASN